jgi:hypothetical protein
MVIIDNFIPYKLPSQYVFSGEDYLDIYAYGNRTFKKIRSSNNTSIFTINPEGFKALTQDISQNSIGIILNSGHHIFNILDFDKLPLRRDLQREIIQWRLKKVFPEEISEYDHHFFRLKKNKILSILFKNELKEKIEDLFSTNKINLTYMGNSTINIINHLRESKPSIDFFIEIDQDLFIIVFISDSSPIYVRKFRSDQEEEVLDELIKTISYVKESYKKVLRNYLIISNRSNIDLDLIDDKIKLLDIQPVNLENKNPLFLPG